MKKTNVSDVIIKNIPNRIIDMGFIAIVNPDEPAVAYPDLNSLVDKHEEEITEYLAQKAKARRKARITELKANLEEASALRCELNHKIEETCAALEEAKTRVDGLDADIEGMSSELASLLLL